MKVKELIAELIKCDQEAIVNTNDGALLFVEPLPGYYDGHYEELIKDDNGWVTGIKFTRAGNKVWLNAQTTRDLYVGCDTTEEMDKLIFEFDKSLDISQVESIKKRLNEDRKYAIVINDKVAIATETRKKEQEEAIVFDWKFTDIPHKCNYCGDDGRHQIRQLGNDLQIRCGNKNCMKIDKVFNY